MFETPLCFEDDPGVGAPMDLAEARHRLTLAAEQGDAYAQTKLGMMHLDVANPDQARRWATSKVGDVDGGPTDLAEARRLLGLAAAQGYAMAQFMLGNVHYHGEGGPKDLIEARRLYGLAVAQGHAASRLALDIVDVKDAKAQRAKEQADADAMMKQLLAEDAQEKKAKGAAQSAKSAKTKKARKKNGGKPPAAATNIGTDHALEARDAGVKLAVEDSGEAQAVLMPVAPSPDTVPAANPAAPEPIALFTEAGAVVPVPVAIGGASGWGRGGRGLGGRGLGGRNLGGRGGQRVQSASDIATGGDMVGAVAHLLGQANLQVPVSSSDTGAAALVAAAAPVALDKPPPPPAAVMSLADAQFSTGRPEAPESTIGGQSTCIICFTNPKSHVAVPCGHQCACDHCSAQMQECPVCRRPVQTWVHVHVA